MTADFSNPQTGASGGQDFSGLYTDASAPKDPNQSDELYKALQAANGTTTDAASGGKTQAAKTSGSQAPAPTGSAAGDTKQSTASSAAAGSSAQPSTNPQSTQNPAGDQEALLARLAPLGIKSISELKSKSDFELRQLSTDAVQYEQRQRDLAKNFYRNPDGSWDFTKGPDGRPTGLDATGKAIPVGQGGATTPVEPAPGSEKPAPKPAQPAQPLPKAKKKAKPRKKPTKVTVRPTVAKRRVPKRHPTRVTVAHKKKKPAHKSVGVKTTPVVRQALGGRAIV